MERVPEKIATTRAHTDASLDAERAGADEARGGALLTTQRVHDDLAERRHDTDEQLTAERTGADSAVSALVEVRSTLAHVQFEESRRGDVLGMVSHDLRGPLTVIALNAQLIADDTREASTREAASEIVTAAARMERLLTDLLDVARFESGILAIHTRSHDLTALVNDVLRTYRPLFATQGTTFTAEVPGHSVCASFDHDRVVQVLSNLLGNAMKFTVKGNVLLRIEEFGPHVEVMVRDTGRGIHPDALPHVFERFWHADDTARRGLGLGLYICEKIVHAHGGRMSVESELGHGATFRFTLPSG